MNIRTSDDLKVISSDLLRETGPQIIIKNSDTKKTIKLSGCVLEALFNLNNQHLLFTTDDCPFEEGLHIYLLDNSLKVLDFLELYAPYTPAILRNIKIIDPNKINFAFFHEEEKWELTVLETPKFLPFKNQYPVRKKFSSFFKKSNLVLTHIVKQWA